MEVEMGLLVDGQWKDRWYDTASTGGRFVRKDTSFHDAVSDDGSTAYPVEAGRYHLYVALACPWAHRTLIFRALRGLEAALPCSVVDPDMLDQGWQFSEGHEDRLFGSRHLHEVYTHAQSDYTGRVTVPILFDTVSGSIVNNESSEIIRMLNGPFSALGEPLDATDFYPPHLREEIDAVNERVYHTVNNGVYKCGFATKQAAYDEAVEELFASLDWLEARLTGQRWLAGDQITEADWRLFTTLYRFDPVYHLHFKCSRRRLRDYPALWAHTRRLYNQPGVAATCDLEEIRRHYFYSHESINPNRIVPTAPDIDYSI
jgi:putative glutathione S-transferase